MAKASRRTLKRIPAFRSEAEEARWYAAHRDNLHEYVDMEDAEVVEPQLVTDREGHRGAIVQMGMAVMAHNAATLRRIHQDRLSQRAQKFRRLLRLKRHNVNEFKVSKN